MKYTEKDVKEANEYADKMQVSPYRGIGWTFKREAYLAALHKERVRCSKFLRSHAPQLDGTSTFGASKALMNWAADKIEAGDA